jgi:hypothetical protein
MKRIMAVCGTAVLLAACQTATYEPMSEKLPALTVSFADTAWDGKTVPKGQQCNKFGGNGSTPSLVVEGIPAQANAIIVEFNDASYAELSTDGGHGKIGFWIEGGGKAVLASVKGQTDEMPHGTFLEKRNRATGSFATPGYLPPCSGGAGNSYFANVKAVYKAKSEYEKSKLLATGTIQLGKY